MFELYHPKQDQKDRFFAHIRRKSDEIVIGEIEFYPISDSKQYDFHIIIYESYRKLGYALPSLKLLIDQAFVSYPVECLCHEFEIAKNEISAWKTCFSAGFREKSRENGLLSLYLTREIWLEFLDEDTDDENESDPFYSFRMRF